MCFTVHVSGRLQTLLPFSPETFSIEHFHRKSTLYLSSDILKFPVNFQLKNTTSRWTDDAERPTTGPSKLSDETLSYHDNHRLCVCVVLGATLSLSVFPALLRIWARSRCCSAATGLPSTASSRSPGRIWPLRAAGLPRRTVTKRCDIREDAAETGGGVRGQNETEL